LIWLGYPIFGAVAVAVIQRLLGVHFGSRKRLFMMVVSVLAAAALATQVANVDTNDGIIVVIVGSVLKTVVPLP
jgi:hypothetical protein